MRSTSASITGSGPTRKRCSRPSASATRLRGKGIAWEDGEGTADGIDEHGNLLVATGAGESVSLGAGEVHLRVDPKAA